MQAKVQKTMNSVLGFVAGVSTVALLGTAMAQTPAESQMQAEKMARPDFLQKIERSVEKIEKGIVVTMTSSDSDIVKKLQEHSEKRDEKHPDDGKVSFEHKNIENGVQLTITSNDSDIIKKIQDSDGKPPMSGKHGMRGKRGMPFFDKNVERKVENTSDGVTITLTSSDSDSVKKLQNRAEKKDEKRPDDGKVQFSVENLTNGVKIHISSTDPDVVKKIQDREKHPFFMNKKGEGLRNGVSNEENQS